jgi:branched-chain amino acid transport system permease protein
MRGDYLAIVTLGSGDRAHRPQQLDEPDQGPNGILASPRRTSRCGLSDGGLAFETIAMRKLFWMYYIILALAVFTVVAVRRLNFSRIGRAWEAIRGGREPRPSSWAWTPSASSFWPTPWARCSAGWPGPFSRPGCALSARELHLHRVGHVLAMVVLGGLGPSRGDPGALALVALPEVFPAVRALPHAGLRRGHGRDDAGASGRVVAGGALGKRSDDEG